MYCTQRYPKRATGNAIGHLRKHEVHSPHCTKVSNAQRTLHSYRQVDAGRLRELIAELLVDRRHSFVEVENDKFRKIIEYINPLAVSKMPKSANTSRADVMKCFEVVKLIIKENITAARFKIHLSFDL